MDTENLQENPTPGKSLYASTKIPKRRLTHPFFAVRRDVDPDLWSALLLRGAALAIALEARRRARLTPGIEPRTGAPLAVGEALLGDYTTFGVERGRYRSALDFLSSNSCLKIIRATNRGTVVSVKNSVLFDLGTEYNNQPDDQPITNNQPSGNQREATKIDVKIEKRGKEPPPTTGMHAHENPLAPGSVLGGLDIACLNADSQDLVRLHYKYQDYGRWKSWAAWGAVLIDRLREYGVVGRDLEDFTALRKKEADRKKLEEEKAVEEEERRKLELIEQRIAEENIRLLREYEGLSSQQRRWVDSRASELFVPGSRAWPSAIADAMRKLPRFADPACVGKILPFVIPSG